MVWEPPVPVSGLLPTGDSWGLTAAQEGWPVFR